VVRKASNIQVATNYLMVGQVHKLLFTSSDAHMKLCESTFRAAIPALHKESDRAVLSRLRALQAIGLQAPHVTLARVKCITSALEELGVPDGVVDVVAELVKAKPPTQRFNLPASANVASGPPPTQPSGQSVPPPNHGHHFKPSPTTQAPFSFSKPISTANTTIPSATPSTTSDTTSSYPLKLDIPVLLDHQMRETYGLLTATNQHVPSPLKEQVADFMTWSKSLIQLDRWVKSGKGGAF
jgi:hypothetical protein